MTAAPPEKPIADQLRAVLYAGAAFAFVMLVLSFVPVTITDARYQRHTGRMLDVPHKLLLVTAFIPSGWVVRNPTTKRVLGLALPVAATCAAILQSLHLNNIDPAWVVVAFAFSCGMVVLMIVLVLPITRIAYPDPPGLPEARTNRRD